MTLHRYYNNDEVNYKELPVKKLQTNSHTISKSTRYTHTITQRIPHRHTHTHTLTKSDEVSH
jgi:hypothetical protein